MGKNIAVFIGNRADAGPLGPVVKAIRERIGYAAVLDGIDPDLDFVRLLHGHDGLVVLGDRHELLIACHAALLAQIPIAHIHGGETTLGSFDDKVRNAVSQLADIHFTAAAPFSDKLISMGINRDRVFTVGPPGLDDLETDDASEFGSGFLLVCLHPDTTQSAEYNYVMAGETSVALGRLGRRVAVISPNDDPGAKEIRRGLGEHYGTQLVSLDRRRYLTALKHAAVCIGNSSSFVIEAPALGTPTVLVGDRQKGRPLANTIRRAAPDAEEIVEEIIILTELVRPAPRDLPYGRGGASTKIAEVLATWTA